MMKKQNGITLIALVITIIVLLILAGVSIAMLTGDNGILNKARTAGEETKAGSTREAVKLAIAEIITDNEGFPTKTGIEPSELKSAINKVKEDQYTVECKEKNANGNIEVIFTKTGETDAAYTYYVVASSGVINDKDTAPVTTPTEP